MISAKKLIKLQGNGRNLLLSAKKEYQCHEPLEAWTKTVVVAHHQGVEKGDFVVYSADQKRFVLSLEYLSNEIVRELLRLAEEEFGLPSSGLLMLPCEAEFMEYAISLIRSNVTRDVEKAFLMSTANSRCSFQISILK